MFRKLFFPPFLSLLYAAPIVFNSDFNLNIMGLDEEGVAV